MKTNAPIPNTIGLTARGQISFVPVAHLIPDRDNPRKHSRTQIRAIGRSIDAFGFNAPILVDRNLQIIAGHGRYEAAKILGLAEVPVIFLDHLTKTQARAYMLADNKLTDRSTWDDPKVAALLKELSGIVLDFDIEAIGFEPPEIDFRIQSLDTPDAVDDADEFNVVAGPAVSIAGDLWQLGPHRLCCENALVPTAYATLMEAEKAAAVFADPPYNVRIDGNVSGHGSITHREFAMGSGEMSDVEFADFLAASQTLICAYCVAGALIYNCMDWRHMGEMLAAGRSSGCELLNLCVWAKNNGRLGSLYRSQHELVFVFRNGSQPHLNNIQFGRFGRNRTNVWNYAKVNSFARKGSKSDLELHPTVKPITLVSDAILDSTKRSDIVLDPFLGSGTTILAAERTGRRCYGIEIDPLYVDTAVDRWQRMTGRQAQNAHGETFAELKARRGVSA
jgi:DNA modification methylase